MSDAASPPAATDCPVRPANGPSLRFGDFAEGYDVARPDYPAEAVEWLIDGYEGPIVEVGAGTGRFTRGLAELGMTVLATEPDPAMLGILRRRVPGAHAIRATAEELPLVDQCAGVVIAAQTWHWLDTPRAWESVTRVLRPSGHLGVVWNGPSLGNSWQREIAELGPTISPIRDGWWPQGIPRRGTQTRMILWQELLTARQVRDEHATHLAVRKLKEPQRSSYLNRVLQIAEAASGSGGYVAYERLTWCGRVPRA